jgi:hypothetical protein
MYIAVALSQIHREKAEKYYHNNTKWRAYLGMLHKYHKQTHADRKVVKWGVLFYSIYMRGHSPLSQMWSHPHPHPAKKRTINKYKDHHTSHT